jgi:hypothetical protein
LLASLGRHYDALRNFAYLRMDREDSESVLHEMEIDAAIEGERTAREGLGLKEAFFGKSDFIRFVIAFVILQWAGQKSGGRA